MASRASSIVSLISSSLSGFSTTLRNTYKFVYWHNSLKNAGPKSKQISV